MLCSVRRLLPCCYVPSGGHADGHGGVSAQTCHTLVHSVHRCFMLVMHMHHHRHHATGHRHHCSSTSAHAVVVVSQYVVLPVQ